MLQKKREPSLKRSAVEEKAVRKREGGTFATLYNDMIDMHLMPVITVLLSNAPFILLASSSQHGM